MTDESLVERIKRRALFRRAELAPNRYVRFERKVERQLQQLSNATRVEGAELVRILIDEALERRGLQPISRDGAPSGARQAARQVAGPKAHAGLASPAASAATRGPIEELMPA